MKKPPISGFVALGAGVLVLIFPDLLAYLVALYLIVTGGLELAEHYRKR